MKKLQLLFMVTIASLTSILCAESFIIVNTLSYPVDYKVITTRGGAIVGTVLGNKGQSPLLTITDPLLWIEWLDNGIRYIAHFEEYRSMNNGKLTLQKNKKNFFNIRADGAYMHNFGGKIIEEKQEIKVIID